MLYILAVLLPPLAVALTNRGGAFVVNCVLTVCCLYIGGIGHALLVVNDHYRDKRNARLEAEKFAAMVNMAKGTGKANQ